MMKRHVLKLIGFEDSDKYNGEFLEDEMTNILDLI